MLIAESDLNDPRLLWSLDRGGFGIDAQWSDDFHHALHAVLTGERGGYYEDFGRLEHLAKALRHAYVYDGQHSKHPAAAPRAAAGRLVRAAVFSATCKTTTRSAIAPPASEAATC